MSSKRTDCEAKAAICRQQAQKDPSRREHWMRVAEQWEERGARENGKRAATTHEVHGGRMIPKPAKS